MKGLEKPSSGALVVPLSATMQMAMGDGTDEVYEAIFPNERKERFVQTEWATGWGATTSGFRLAAEHLTKNAHVFRAEIDQVGLAVFFMQRHRIELVLKALNEAAGVEFKPTHSLRTLWSRCEAPLRKLDAKNWKTFKADHDPLIDAIARVDDGSFTFRYPVDTKGVEVERPQFVDLAALNEYVDKFMYDAHGWVDWIWEMKALEREYEREMAAWGDR